MPARIAQWEIAEEKARHAAMFDDVPGRADDHGRDAVRFEMTGDQTDGLVADGSKCCENRRVDLVFAQSPQDLRCVVLVRLPMTVIGRCTVEAWR